MVVTTGVSTRPDQVSGRKSKLLWMTSNSAARSKTDAMWRHSTTFGVTVGSSDQPCSTTETRRARVTESPVANRVTSTPRSTRPSVSSEANSSHGP